MKFIFTNEFVFSVLKYRNALSDSLVKELNSYYQRLEMIKAVQESLILSARLVDSIPGTRDQKNGNVTDKIFNTITSDDFIDTNNERIEILEQIKKAQKKYSAQTRICNVYNSISVTYPVHWNIVYDVTITKALSHRAAGQKYFVNKDLITPIIEETVELVTVLCNSSYKIADSDKIADFISADLNKKLKVREH